MHRVLWCCTKALVALSEVLLIRLFSGSGQLANQSSRRGFPFSLIFGSAFSRQKWEYTAPRGSPAEVWVFAPSRLTNYSKLIILLRQANFSTVLNWLFYCPKFIILLRQAIILLHQAIILLRQAIILLRQADCSTAPSRLLFCKKLIILMRRAGCFTAVFQLNFYCSWVGLNHSIWAEFILFLSWIKS